MTIEDAVRILNEKRHHGHSKWYVSGEFVCGDDQYEFFTHFEAIAIAEKYQEAKTVAEGSAPQD